MSKKLLTVRIDEEKLESFREYCETMNTSMSESIQHHVNQCLGIETPVTTIEEIKNNFDDDLRKIEGDVKRQNQRITENQYSIGLLLERIGQLEGKIDKQLDNDRQVDKIDNNIDGSIDNNIEKKVTIPDLKKQLDSLGISYRVKAKKSELLELLGEQKARADLPLPS